MIPLLRASLVLGAWVHNVRFERATQRPDIAQAELLRDLARQNTDTAFGREHGFSTVRTPADYARRVPIRDYEGFRPYINRIAAREEGVLTPEAPCMFATTSGTTGEPKLIPVTPSWRDEMAGLMRLWMLRVARDHPHCFDHGILSLASPAIEGMTPTGIPFGAMSGVAYQRVPWVARRRFVVPYAVTLARDYEARYFVTMRLALTRRVSLVAAVNPSTLIRLAEIASGRAEEIIRAIHNGTLGIPTPQTMTDPGQSPGNGIREIEAAIRPNPDRARVLGRIVEQHGALLPRHSWPDLRLVACWLGGSAGIQARRLPDLYGETPQRDLGLMASEGRMTIPIEDDTAAGILAVGANFYEFIPEERIDDRSAPVLLSHELEDGKRYYLILSARNGLYRYDINDIVEVRGFHHGTPKVAFVRKGRDMVSIMGEKLHLNQIHAAVREAEDGTKLDVWQFRLIPDVDRRRYDLLVELRQGLGSPAEGQAFLCEFDRALFRLNVEYASKRQSGRLGRPCLYLMRPGWSERLCRAEFLSGKREAQHKWQALRPAWDEASRKEVAKRLDQEPEPLGSAIQDALDHV